jgi:hypothetical protein
VTRTWTQESDTGESSTSTGYNINLERFGRRGYNSLWYNDFPQDFEAQSGRMPELVGYKELGTHNDFAFRGVIPKVNSLQFTGGAKARFNPQGTREEEYLWTASEVSMSKLWTKIRFFYNHEFVNSTDFKYSGFEYEIWNSPKHFMEYYASLMWGGAAHYTEEITGWKYRLHTGITLKPVSRVVLNTSVSREDFYREYATGRSYLQTVTWNKLSFRVAPGMFVRGIYQYNRISSGSDPAHKVSDASMLFSYEYRPLSNIYVGTNFNNFSRLDQMGDNLEIFAKLSYLWRI